MADAGFVQQTAFTGLTPTIPAAFNGNMLIMFVVAQRSPSARTVSSVATTNVTWTRGPTADGTNGHIAGSLWLGTVGGGDSGTTVTLTMSGSGSTVAGLIVEFNGVPVSPKDGNGANATGTSTTPATGSFTPGLFNDLVVAMVAYESGTAPSVQPGGAWNNLTFSNNSTTCGVQANWLVTASKAAQSASWTIGATGDAWVATIQGVASLAKLDGWHPRIEQPYPYKNEIVTY